MFLAKFLFIKYQQEPISKPMLLTLNKKESKDALDLFKNVLTYMGDRQSKQPRDQIQIGHDIGTQQCPLLWFMLFCSCLNLLLALGFW